MNVTPSDVKKLRDRTGAGMLDCKKALLACGGDFQAAQKHLREQGLAHAVSRGDRATHQGALFIHQSPGKCSMIELTCETDFVSKNRVFRETGAALAQLTATSKEQGSYKQETDEKVKEAMFVLKENIVLKRVFLMEHTPNETVVGYAHNEGQMGTLLKLACKTSEGASSETVRQMAHDLALHATAFRPLFLDQEQVPASYKEEQRAVFAKQVESMDKPANILATILEKKVAKQLAEVSFLQQKFVKDESLTVKQVLEKTGKTLGEPVQLVEFISCRAGEEDPS